MPYTHRKVGDKECVFKKGKKGKKVGCTKGSIKKYLAALHANVINEDYSEKIQDTLRNKYSEYLKALDIYETNSSLILTRIELKKEYRGKGIGRRIMEDLVKYADSNGQIIALTPSPDFAGDNVNKGEYVNFLTKFYKKFGFKMNKGVNKNFLFKDTMLREPLKLGQKRVNEYESNDIYLNDTDKIFVDFYNRNDIIWVPTDSVLKMSAPTPTHISDNEWDELWDSLQNYGMKTPLELTTDGHMIRLDSGNHRIRLFAKYGIDSVPCTIKKVEDVVVSPNNGTHKGIELSKLKNINMIKLNEGKMVNENKLTHEDITNKIYYHGGDSEITKFSYDVEKKNIIGNVSGFYFTDIKHVALGYGKVLTKVKLKVKNTFIFGITEPNTNMAVQYRKELINENPHIDKYNDWFDDKVQKLFQYKKLPFTGMDGMAEQRVYKAGGFDSVKDGHELCVFDSDNIEIISSKMVNENENKLVGGKADNLTPKDIANKFKVSVKYIKDQIKNGKKIESEHTDDEEKQIEIAEDHISEIPDYYERIEKMEKKAKKYWDKKLNENKIFIKKLLRENLVKSINPRIKDQLYQQMDELGVNPIEVGRITINGKEINLDNNEDIKKSIQNIGLACTLTLGVLSCNKEQEHAISINSNVKGIEYTTDNNTKNQDVDTINVLNFNGDDVNYRVDKKSKSTVGIASHGLSIKERFTEEQYFIYAFGQTIDEEIRSNRASSKPNAGGGEKIVDFKPSKYSSSPSIDYSRDAYEKISDTPLFKKAIEYLSKSAGLQNKFNKEAEEYGLPNLNAQNVISGKYN